MIDVINNNYAYYLYNYYPILLNINYAYLYNYYPTIKY